jgi:hypothetical protein
MQHDNLDVIMVEFGPWIGRGAPRPRVNFRASHQAPSPSDPGAPSLCVEPCLVWNRFRR